MQKVTVFGQKESPVFKIKSKIMDLGKFIEHLEAKIEQGTFQDRHKNKFYLKSANDEEQAGIKNGNAK